MINAGKVVRQLELQLDDLQKYAADDELLILTQGQAKEIIALLKEQEAVEPKVEEMGTYRLYRCPKCHKCFLFKKQMYCDQCGQAVKWE